MLKVELNKIGCESPCSLARRVCKAVHTSREKYGMELGLAVPCSRSSVLVVGLDLEVWIEAWYGAW